MNLKSLSSAFLFISILCGLLFQTGCGSPTNSSNQPSTSVPRAPSGIIALVGDGQVTLSWNRVSSAASYNIYRSTTTGVSKATGTKISALVVANSYADTTGLVIGATYYYIVTAVNTNGESSESAQVSVTIPPLAPPTAVSAVAGDGKVTLSWSPVPFALSYNIYRSTSAGQPGSKINQSAAASPYIDNGLTNGTAYYYVVTAVSGTNESAGSTEVAAMPAVAPIMVTVTGTVRYADKEYDVNGFTGATNYKSVRFASVEVVDVVSNAVIPNATTTTDSTGSYSIVLSSQTSTVYVRVNSSATLTPGHTVDVKDLSAALYGVPSKNIVPTGNAMVNIDVPVTNTAAGAFNILDVYVSAFQFVQSLSGTYPPALTAYWQIGNPNGTWFCTSTDPTNCPNGTGIYVLNQPDDSDEYDDDVLWHEFGHFTAAKFSRDDSPGGVHYLTSNDLDLRLSWSEGWGDFFPGAIKSWLSANHPELLSTPPAVPLSQYVDTVVSPLTGVGISIDINSPTQDPYVYASSEIAVAKVLWNLMASTGTGHYGMKPVWDVITSFSALNSSNFPLPDQVNLETFWDGWLQQNSPSGTSLQLLQTIFSERKIDYKPDSFENPNDGSFNSAHKYVVLGTQEVHTLYPAGDADYVAFDVTSTTQSFTIRTNPVRSGAATIITLYGSNTIPVRTVDNSTPYSGSVPSIFVPSICDNLLVCHENRPDLLSSQISGFTFPSPGTYYVNVTSSPDRPLSAGRYGSYTLSITSP